MHKEIMQKQEILDRSKVILKEEFVGIDHVIDEVIDAVSSWYLFPDLQEKPIVINLWGLTGVGKSSLVRRLAQLIEFENKFYHFDLGENDRGERGIKSRIEKIYDNTKGVPVLLAFDELQHARTRNEIGREMDKTAFRVIWQILDSGQFQASQYNSDVDELYELIQQLRYLLKNGVQVSNGKVVSREEYFIEHMGSKGMRKSFNETEDKTDASSTLFVPSSYHKDIFSLAKEKFSTHFEIMEKLTRLDGYETIEFLLEIFHGGNSPKIVDCSKCLVFVLGNIDEAYTMSEDFNPDMDADEFHEQSLKINVPVIKRALKKRFRNEQISRLGNMHIIYPAFSKESFKRIIELELSKISEKVRRNQKIKMKFDQSVHDLIYKEGVYPTQGTRPIFTTIHMIVSTKLGRIVTEIMLKNLAVSTILLKAKNGNIISDYYKGDRKLHSLSLEHKLNLENLRKNKRDDVQAITAVHEAGHAIISIILLRTVPEMIYSTSADAGSGGFVYTKFKWNYISRKEITSRIALFLGGIAAEKIVFGEENITTGAEDDIRKATIFTTEMLKQCGMGRLPVSYAAKHVQTRYYVHDEHGRVCKEAETWISKAMTLAEKTLKEQETLLLKMADYLSDNREMSKQQVIGMVKEYAYSFDLHSIIENGDLLFYREHLKEKVTVIDSALESKSKPSINFCVEAQA